MESRSHILTRQSSSADTQQRSSSVVLFVSVDSSDVPPGLVSPEANRVNAADLIRGRGALRPFAASAQTAGTSVSAADGNNPPPSVQAARNRAQAAVSTVQQETIRSIQRMV